MVFQVGDMVLLKVSPWKGVIRFKKRGKLGPRFIGPLWVISRVSKVAYILDLPEDPVRCIAHFMFRGCGSVYGTRMQWFHWMTFRLMSA